MVTATSFSLLQVVLLCLGSGGLASVAVAYIGSVPTLRQARVARLQLDLETRKFDLEREQHAESKLAEAYHAADVWEERARKAEQELTMKNALCVSRGSHCLIEIKVAPAKGE